MTLTRFKTDRRWWFWISLVLFVVPWLLPIWGVKGSSMPPGNCWIILFTHHDHFGETMTFIGIFSLLFGVPAISIGWILHCFIVMIRGARRQRTQNAGFQQAGCI
jgi:hypothetical protein